MSLRLWLTSPRAWALRLAEVLAARSAIIGTRMPPASRPAASSMPARPSSVRQAPTAAAPASPAAIGGATPRMNRSCVASTSPTSRDSRSADLKAGRPAGARVSSFRQMATRVLASTRNATSCEARRSAYLKTPRPMLSPRTATTAIASAAMPGCCDARASRNPETASSATPQMVASAPVTAASNSRPRSGPARRNSRSSGSPRGCLVAAPIRALMPAPPS